MNAELRARLEAMWEDGKAFDAAQADRLDRRRNVETDTIKLVAMFVRAMRAANVLEIGTSNGYSAIWLADALADTGGRLTSVDNRPIDDARRNLDDAGFPDVTLVQRDAGELLAELPDDSVDLLFLDAERTEYPGWWPHPVRVVRPGGVIVVDNELKPDPTELLPFFALTDADPALVSASLPHGKGVRLLWKRGPAADFR